MVRVDTTVPVLVLRSVRHGGVGIARSLGRIGVPVYVLDKDPHTPAFSSRYCAGRFVWDLDRERTPAADSLAYLEDVGRRIGGRAILVPTSDDAALFVAEYAETLARWFQFSKLRVDLVQSLCSKKQMYCLAKRHGVPTAEAVFPRSREDVERAIDSMAFPVMLKGINGRRLRLRAGQPMFMVDTPEDLLARYDAIDEPGVPNLMVQEFIPGAEDSVWMYNGYFDAQSRCLAAFGGQKLRQRPAATGPTCLGVCARNPVVEETSRRFMKALGYQGIVDIDYRLDERDGQYKILDVNPRLGGTFRLFVSPDGTDVVRAMYLDLTGQPVEAPAAVEGRKWMVEDSDLAAAWQALRQGRLSIGRWRSSLEGVAETAYWAADDPGPLARAMANNVKKTFSRLLG